MSEQNIHVQQNQGELVYDHIAKVRHLVWSLRESLSNLYKIAAQNINYNSSVDSGVHAKHGTMQIAHSESGESVPRLDKAMEDFYSVLNQIELHLKTIQVCAIQQRQSNKFLPFPVSNHKNDAGYVELTPTDQTISFNQLLMTAKRQIAFVEGIEKILLEGARRIGE